MDVLVIGAGPAGLAATAALAGAGLEVACLSPEHPPAWPNTYGVWLDELEGLGFDDVFEARWADPAVYPGAAPDPAARLGLGRAYGRVDNVRLRQALVDRADHGGAAWLRGAATTVEHEDDRAVVRTRDGRSLTARLVVDASGHATGFVRRDSVRQPAVQVAFGLVGRFEHSPIGDDGCVLMDYRAGHLPDDGGPATFLYAMDLGQGRWFVEETVLASRPAPAIDRLEARLQRRLEHRGAAVTAVEDVERCFIPMGTPLPELGQRTVGFGAAATMVHPATGYQLGRALRTAPALAAAVADALGGPDASSQAASQAAWAAVWPDDALHAHTFYRFGLEALLRLDPSQTRHFFAAFFGLEQPDWSGYMSGTLDADRLPAVMWRLFSQASMRLRIELARSALGRGGVGLVREVLVGRSRGVGEEAR